MTYCFNCRSELPDASMIYCSECSLWSNDADPEPETVIRDLTAAPATFVGQIAAPRAPRRKLWISLAAALGMLMLSLAGIFFLTRDGSRSAPVMNASSIGSGRNNIHEGGAQGVTASVDERDQAAVSPGIGKLTTSIVATAAVKQRQNPVAVSTERIRTAIAPKQAQMRTRIEIVDGVERCYALPGGREISC